MDPTSFHQQAKQETFFYPTLYFLSFADKLTFVKNISHTGPQENTFFGFETQNKTRRLEKKTILSNFYSGAAILIFVCLPATFAPQLRTWVFVHKIVICG